MNKCISCGKKYSVEDGYDEDYCQFSCYHLENADWIYCQHCGDFFDEEEGYDEFYCSTDCYEEACEEALIECRICGTEFEDEEGYDSDCCSEKCYLQEVANENTSSYDMSTIDGYQVYFTSDPNYEIIYWSVNDDQYYAIDVEDFVDHVWNGRWK